MKKLIICFFFSVSIIDLYSQARETKAYEPQIIKSHRFGANVGGSAATGNFGSDNVDDENSGLASGGIIIDFHYSYGFNKYLSATYFTGFGVNFFNKIAFKSSLSSPNSAIKWDVNSTPYITIMGLVGIKGILNLHENVTLYANPVFGPSLLVTPKVNIIASLGNNRLEQTILSSSSFSTLYGGSLGIDLYLNEFYSLNLDVLLLKGSFEIDQEFETFDVNGNPTIIKYSYKQDYSTRNISIGLVYNF